MKKQALLIISLVILLSLTSRAYAQQDYWHTSDKYGVELDGEGDAFVVAILTFEGLKENVNTYTINLEIPGTRINVLKAIQTSYSYYSPYNYDQGYYNQPQQTNFITYSLNRLSDSTLITLNLKTPVQPNQQTTIVLIYQSSDIANKVLNGLDFTFQTIKDSNAIIRDVGADVYVPSNMQLKGKPKFDVQYSPSILAGTFSTMSSTASVSSDQMSQYLSPYYNRASQFSAQNLDPGESFTVKGLYGDNVFLLYLYEILVLIAVIIIAALIIKHFRVASRVRSSFNPKTAGAPRVKATSTTSVEFSWLRVSVSGISSGFLYVISSLLIQFITSLFSSLGSYGYMFPLMIILYIILFLLPVAALFAPAVYLARSYSWKEGLLCFILGVITAVFLLYIVSVSFPIANTYY